MSGLELIKKTCDAINNPYDIVWEARKFYYYAMDGFVEKLRELVKGGSNVPEVAKMARDIGEAIYDIASWIDEYRAPVCLDEKYNTVNPEEFRKKIEEKVSELVSLADKLVKLVDELENGIKAYMEKLIDEMLNTKDREKMVDLLERYDGLIDALDFMKYVREEADDIYDYIHGTANALRK